MMVPLAVLMLHGLARFVVHAHARVGVGHTHCHGAGAGVDHELGGFAVDLALRHEMAAAAFDDGDCVARPCPRRLPPDFTGASPTRNV
jgi:hypothetical protein